MCLNMLELDREMGDFPSFLDSTGVDYAVALTADHGGQETAESGSVFTECWTPGASIPRSRPPRSGKAIGAKLGLSGPSCWAMFSETYLWIEA